MGDYRFGRHGGPAALVQGYGGLGEPAIKRGVPLLALAITGG
jgi:hypothetical protein